MPANLDLFPHSRPRRGQAEFLADARQAVQDGLILLAQAPTGLGKTAVALTSTVEGALHGGKKVLFTTCRRSQHRIAVETLRGMRAPAGIAAIDIIAAEAMCPGCTHDVGKTHRLRAVARSLLRRPLHVQEAVQLARRFDVCPRAAALEAARGATIVVCDYNYLFGPQGKLVLRALELELQDTIVVVDEAHNLPSRARKALSTSVTAEELEALSSRLAEGRASRALLDMASSLREASRFIGGDSRLPVPFLKNLLGGRREGRSVGDGRRLASMLGALVEELPGAMRSTADETLRLLHDWPREDRLRLLSRRGGGCLSLVALDPRPATQEVFEGVDSAILMSGTLHPGRMYVDLLGIPPGRSRVRSYTPDFPPGNRLLLASPELTSAYKQREESYEAFARTIVGLCRSVPGNVAAFFPSYEMAREVGRLIEGLGPPKPLVWERKGQTKDQKESLLGMLESRRYRGGCLLMAVQGGSLSEGVDYPGNLLQAVVIAGLGLEPPHLEVEALRSLYSRRFGRRRGYEYAYLYPALNRLVQCAGRCIRSGEDVAAVVILDRRVLRDFYRSRLPDGFRPEACSDLAARVRSFFYERQVVATVADKAGSRGGPEADGVDGAEGGGEGPAFQGLPPPPA